MSIVSLLFPFKRGRGKKRVTLTDFRFYFDTILRFFVASIIDRKSIRSGCEGHLGVKIELGGVNSYPENDCRSTVHCVRVVLNFTFLLQLVCK